MRDWIAVIVAVLGVLLVLAGAVLLALPALARPVAPVEPPTGDVTSDVDPAPAAVAAPAPVSARLLTVVKQPSPADRLIFWGVVLLVLAAVAAGAISFELGAKGGS